MACSVRVTWGVGETANVSSVTELDLVLDAVDQQARASHKPQDVQLNGGEAGTLGVVVGADRSFLNHVPANLDPPCMASVGDDLTDRPFTFYVAGDHHSEAAWRQTVPIEVARATARHWVARRGLDPRVRWEEI
jgi:hypothetical protein